MSYLELPLSPVADSVAVPGSDEDTGTVEDAANEDEEELIAATLSHISKKVKTDPVKVVAEQQSVPNNPVPGQGTKFSSTWVQTKPIKFSVVASRSQSFLLTGSRTLLILFKAFQESFARHCALLSCVDEARRAEITLKVLGVTFEKINHYYRAVMLDSSDSVDDSDVGKVKYENYIANLKVICSNVESDSEELLTVIGITNFSYKNPRQFITATRNKFKCGVWECSDDYDSNKLYTEFRDICMSELNIIH